jgi:hypothetical protein
MSLTRSQAVNQLAFMCQINEYPELTNDEISMLIDSNVRSADWQANYAYVYGDIVEPVIKNGRYYTCVQAGTSGTSSVFPIRYTQFCNGVGFIDANLVWMDSGPANVERYDLRSAARAGWILKAAKAANLINSKDGSQDIQLEALQKQCLLMAEKYRPLVIY